MKKRLLFLLIVLLCKIGYGQISFIVKDNKPIRNTSIDQLKRLTLEDEISIDWSQLSNPKFTKMKFDNQDVDLKSLPKFDNKSAKIPAKKK